LVGAAAAMKGAAAKKMIAWNFIAIEDECDIY
jgi:hypothetical protein